MKLDSGFQGPLFGLYFINPTCTSNYEQLKAVSIQSPLPSQPLVPIDARERRRTSRSALGGDVTDVTPLASYSSYIVSITDNDITRPWQ